MQMQTANADRLIIGLGNVGTEYEFTRHNIAWLVIDQLFFFPQLHWKKKFKGLYALYSRKHRTGTGGNTKGIFLKPHTYMNSSGISVNLCAQFFKIPLENILVIHDEVNLPFGTLAFKGGGGAGGHNGVRSIMEHMGSCDFLRLKMGVGRPEPGTTILSDYLLSSCFKEEEPLLGDYLAKAAQAVELYLERGHKVAANTFNRKNLIGEIGR